MPEEIPNFPELSRAPQMDEDEETEDTTIRDKMTNGKVYARPAFTRLRETFKINFRYLTAEDRRALREFKNQVGGWGAFRWVDSRDKANPEEMLVRFTKLPTFKDDGIANGAKTFKTSFEITQI